MVVNTTKDNLCVNKIIGEKTDTFMVEGDIIVPDVKPDILNAVHTSGNVCIYKKEVLDGKIKIDGVVNCYVMYLSDTENSLVRGLTSSLDFTKVIEIDDARENMLLEEALMVRSIDCRVLNGRKVNLKAEVMLQAKVYANEEVEVVKTVEDMDDLQTLSKELKINSLKGMRNY